MTTLAARMFAAQLEQSGVEHDLGEVVAAAGLEDWDHTVDYYDESIEMYAPDVSDVGALGALLMAQGFARCWIHRHAGGRAACDQPRCKSSTYFVRGTDGTIGRFENDGSPPAAPEVPT